MDENPAFRITIQSKTLFNKYPSHWRDEYKNKIFDISCPAGCNHHGELQITRWRAKSIPTQVNVNTVATEVIRRTGSFRYPIPTDPGSVLWHLNFADGDLFFSYGSRLMAQDEHQVAEHPILASVKEMLEVLVEDNTDYEPCTRDYTHLTPNPPTPILIMGAERRVSIDLSPDAEKGRPNGLYGNRFREAPWDVVEKVLSLLEPPTVSNIIAMEAPSGGKGSYSKEQIEDVFQTAFTAFSAARLESVKSHNNAASITINTGDWGTGAYGGNKVLMATLQLLAARSANINKVIFFTSDGESFAQAQDLAEKLSSSSRDIPDILDKLFRMGFQWGLSDGN
jgi:Poly (ADP-ribose) glycohydrolase (PARG), Macro domain fold